MNRDGSGLRRLTNHPTIDVTPTWSPTGQQIAFVSDRTGTPQIWVMNVDGTGADARSRTRQPAIGRRGRPRRSTRLPTRRSRAAATTSGSTSSRPARRAPMTDGIGSNESPAFSPNGRHIAFTSTRAGKRTDLLIDRDGKNLHQVTKTRHATGIRTGRSRAAEPRRTGSAYEARRRATVRAPAARARRKPPSESEQG